MSVGLTSCCINSRIKLLRWNLLKRLRRNRRKRLKSNRKKTLLVKKDFQKVFKRWELFLKSSSVLNWIRWKTTFTLSFQSSFLSIKVSFDSSGSSPRVNKTLIWFVTDWLRKYIGLINLIDNEANSAYYCVDTGTFRQDPAPQ